MPALRRDRECHTVLLGPERTSRAGHSLTPRPADRAEDVGSAEPSKNNGFPASNGGLMPYFLGIVLALIYLGVSDGSVDVHGGWLVALVVVVVVLYVLWRENRRYGK